MTHIDRSSACRVKYRETRRNALKEVLRSPNLGEVLFLKMMNRFDYQSSSIVEHFCRVVLVETPVCINSTTTEEQNKVHCSLTLVFLMRRSLFIFFAVRAFGYVLRLASLSLSLSPSQQSLALFIEKEEKFQPTSIWSHPLKTSVFFLHMNNSASQTVLDRYLDQQRGLH